MVAAVKSFIRGWKHISDIAESVSIAGGTSLLDSMFGSTPNISCNVASASPLSSNYINNKHTK